MAARELMGAQDLPAPIAVRVTRYRCPCCGRSHSSRQRAVEHIGRCWDNPQARGCKTCRHFDLGDSGEPEVGYPGLAESCTVGVDLDGHPACPRCGGYGWADTNTGAERPCGPDVSVGHIGDGAEVRPGPIVGCDRWEARDDA